MPDNHNCLTCRWASLVCNDGSLACNAPLPVHAFIGFEVFTSDDTVFIGDGHDFYFSSEVTNCPAWQPKEAQEGAGESEHGE